MRTVADTGCSEPVFNLRVEQNHTYFVRLQDKGKAVLVHNDSGDSDYETKNAPLGICYQDCPIPGEPPGTFRRYFYRQGRNWGVFPYRDFIGSRVIHGGAGGTEDVESLYASAVDGLANAAHQAEITAGNIGELVNAGLTASILADGAGLAKALAEGGYRLMVNAAGKEVLSLAGKELTEAETKEALEEAAAKLSKKTTEDAGEAATKGVLTGSLDGLTEAERDFANELLSQGKNVDIVPRGAGKTADFLVDGVSTELKTLTTAGPNTVKNAIESAAQQGKQIIVDARKVDISPDDAIAQVRRAQGNIGGLQGRVTVLTSKGPVTY